MHIKKLQGRYGRAGHKPEEGSKGSNLRSSEVDTAEPATNRRMAPNRSKLRSPKVDAAEPATHRRGVPKGPNKEEVTKTF